MPHAPSAVASCEWGYDAVAHLRSAVGSTLGRVSDMLLTLWALRWCWVGMLAVVAYLRHAVSKGVPGYGRVSSLCDDECGDGDDVAVTMLCRRVGDALFSVTPFV